MKDSLSLFTMLPPFYDKPLYKEVNTYLELIEKEFSIKVRKYSCLQSAFDHDVFIINDKIVFRFPRTERVKEHLRYEIDSLKFLKGKVKINIPNYSYVSKNNEFAGYEIIPGKILTPFIFQILSTKNKESVINQLVEFINEFHGIRLSDFSKYKPRQKDDFINVEKRIGNELEEKLFPKLLKKEIETIENFYEDSKNYLRNIPTSCATHGDLYAYNVVWDDSKSEVGVIDFSDQLIGDPAKDFEVFYDYGSEYAEIAYTKYKGPKDEEFLQRAQIYYKVHSIYTLLSTLCGAHLSFKVAYLSFKQRLNL